MKPETQARICMAAFVCILMFMTGVLSYGFGRASMRAEIRDTIRSQDVRPAKVIKVPQLGLTFIPFEKGFLTWTDGNPRLAKGGK